MKKIIQTVTLFSFSFTYLFSPLFSVHADTTVASTTHASTSTSVTVTAPKSYLLNFISTSSTTWQKSFIQKISYDYANSALGDLINSSAYDLLKNTNSRYGGINSGTYPKIAVYLVPVIQTTPPPSVNRQVFQQYNQNRQTQEPNDLFSNTFLADPSGPSQYLYKNPQKYGYFVGYINKPATTAGQATSSRTKEWGNFDGRSSTDAIPAINFAWVPDGDYYVYLTVGVRTVTLDPVATSTKNNEQLNQFMRNEALNALPKDRAFQIYLPVQNDNNRSQREVEYSKNLVPLPQSASTTATTLSVPGSRYPVRANTTTHYTVVDVTSSSPVTLTPSPKPAVLITAPFGSDEVWNKGKKHDITWLANFKRSNDNNTGIHVFDGITIVPPYGYGISFEHGGTTDLYNSVPGRLVSTFGQYAATAIITSAVPALGGSVSLAAIGLSFSVPVVGIVIGAIVTILDLFGLFDDNSAPFAVGVNAKAYSYNPATNTYGTTTYSLGSNYVEMGKMSVDIDKLPFGTYVIKLDAGWNSNPHIIATSSWFTVGEYVPQIDTVMAIGTSTQGTKIELTGSHFAATNTVSVVKARESSATSTYAVVQNIIPQKSQLCAMMGSTTHYRNDNKVCSDALDFVVNPPLNVHTQYMFTVVNQNGTSNSVRYTHEAIPNFLFPQSPSREGRKSEINQNTQTITVTSTTTPVATTTPPVASTTITVSAVIATTSPAVTSPSHITSIPATITSYTCPTGYQIGETSVRTGGKTTLVQLCQIMRLPPRNSSGSTTPVTLPATPVYSCPKNLTLNTDNTCSKAVSYESDPIEGSEDSTFLGSAFVGLVTFLKVLIAK